MIKMNLLTKISSYFPSLTKSEQKIAQYVLANPNEIEKISIQELAKKAKVGESTIIRFTKKIGFKGYQEFKIELAKNQLKETSISFGNKEKTDINIVHAQLEDSLKDTYGFLDEQDENLKRMAKKINQADCVYLFAAGNSASLAEDFTNRLTRIGKKSIFHSDSHIQAIYASVMSEKDVGLAITVSGNTKDVLTNLSLAGETEASIMAITNYLESGVTRLTKDVVICSPKEYSSVYGSFSSKVSQMFAVDVLLRKIVELDKENIQKLRDKTNNVLIDRLD